MSSDTDAASPPIESVDDLCAILRAGEKRAGELAVGAEHEKLFYFERTLRAADYEQGIRPLLVRLARLGWNPEPDADSPIALDRGRSSITLEPGGQVELSGAPLPSMHHVARELYEHLAELAEICGPLGIRCSSLGLQPEESTATAPWMPKRRYAAMRDYLPAQGRFALDMMQLTATVQANFDFTSESDMVTKMRTAQAISPVVAAVSANSPYGLGVWTGHRSRRYAVWREVDPARCGLLPFVDADDFGYRRYVEWALDVPMIFIRRGSAYLSAGGRTFRRFWREGGGDNGGGSDRDYATIADFENHLSTLFPEVRLKRFIEVRSADACPPAFAIGLVALWKGILYDDEARGAALELRHGQSFADLLAMQIAAAQDGLHGHGSGWHLGEQARELLRLARAGLRRQDCRDASGRDESIYLDALEEVIASGQTRADHLVERFGPGPLDDSALRELLLDSACRWAAPEPELDSAGGPARSQRL